MGERSVFGGARGMGVFLVMLAAALLVFVLLAARAGATVQAGDVVVRAGDGDSPAEITSGDTIVRGGTANSPAEILKGESTVRAARTRQTNGPQSTARATDPIAGQTANIEDKNDDTKPDSVGPIAIAGCTVAADATIMVEDADRTQATLVNGQNVTMTEDSEGISIEGTGTDGNIADENPTGGDSSFDTGTGKVISSTGVTCGNNAGTNTAAAKQQQDKNKGPLAGGLAIGKDVLVKGDLIRTLPDGTRVFGIDQITIETAKCELMATGNELTITLSDQGTPFRLIDGQNVDITIGDDGTIVANGRKELGDLFPAAEQDNPTRVIVPIPVEGSGDNFSDTPNDTFPIISSRGIGGEGCTTTGRSDNPDGVVPGTTPNQTLADTGGMALAPVILALGAILSGAGWMLCIRLRRQQ